MCAAVEVMKVEKGEKTEMDEATKEFLKNHEDELEVLENFKVHLILNSFFIHMCSELCSSGQMLHHGPRTTARQGAD